MLTPEALRAGLDQFGVRDGDFLLFEAPDLKQDQADFPALLEVLVHAVGKTGTLFVPTCTPREGAPKPPFDPAESVSEAGDFSEFFRRSPGVLRSHHPTHSVAAIGPAAEAGVSAHRAARSRPTPWGDSAFGLGSPWEFLYQADAKWILVGARWSTTVLFDYVRALYHQEQLRWTKRAPWPRFDSRALGRELLATRIAQPLRNAEPGMRNVSETTIAQAATVGLSTRKAVDAALDLLESDPTRLRPGRELQRWLETLDSIRLQGYLQAGAALVPITPPIPAVRWDGKRLEGVARDLFVRAVYLSDGSNRVIIALCDLLGLSRPLIVKFREAVQAATGVSASSIMIACTHAHGTPDTVGCGYEKPGYLDFLVDSVRRAAAEAVGSARPARMGGKRAAIRGLARSRRVRLKDGRAYTVRYSVPSTWRVARSLIASAGPIDPDLNVVRIEDLQGRPIAGLSSFGCHPSIALAANEVTGDFSGEAMAGLERVLGDSAVFLCMTGAGGDVDPTLEVPPWGPRDQDSAARLGRIFLAQVLELYERTAVHELSRVQSASRRVSIPAREDWLSLLTEEQDRMCQEFAGQWEISGAVREVLETGTVETEVQAVRLGESLLVGLPGEVLVEMGQVIKNQAPGNPIAIVELANDDIGYIPTRKAFEEGGYEVGRHLWGRITPEGADLLVQAAGEAIRELAGK